ncbi:MAG: DUF4266 domain-containing protein, partial [Gammaproteobacteria bacterium]|nr:DUF4266 domain-containing protein [Gammaproteobacteria bacterium]
MKIIFTLSALFLLSGCETTRNILILEDVKSWEKDVLSKQAMQFPQDDMQSFADEHIYFSKEASTGGSGVGGGGCGCN